MEIESVPRINLLDIIQKINYFLDLLNLDGRKLLMLSVTCKYIREIFFTIKHFPFDYLRTFNDYYCILRHINHTTIIDTYCEFLTRMKCLKTLDLSLVNYSYASDDLHKRQLARTVSLLTTLTQLDFSNNHYFVKSNCFSLLTNLRELTITNVSSWKLCYISMPLKPILSLTQLRKLNISNNSNDIFTGFLDYLSQLINLNELIISNNELDKWEKVELEYSLSKMPGITSLNISKTNLNINLSRMPKLQKLDVSNIKNIHYSIFTSLTQLTSLNLSSINIKIIQISPILSCMTSLISLNLSYNQITSNGLLQLLPVFYCMKELTILDISYNSLRTRKDRAILLQEIPWLRTINLYTNKPHKKE
jgi:hypothetical protein